MLMYSALSSSPLCFCISTVMTLLKLKPLMRCTNPNSVKSTHESQFTLNDIDFFKTLLSAAATSKHGKHTSTVTWPLLIPVAVIWEYAIDSIE